MKSVYGVFDNVSEEFVSTFIANNDRQAKIILKLNIQKNASDDTDVTLYHISPLSLGDSTPVAGMSDLIDKVADDSNSK